ncbi:MAG: hypothetical protein M3M94_02665 [Actinomycetota bacterium]|nr:hypothetical protein [Actinomycetota bacterium]
MGHPGIIRTRRAAQTPVALAAAIAALAVAAMGCGADGANGRTTSANGTARVTGKLVPRRGVLFGVWAGRRDGRTYAQELELLERRIGRRFDLGRYYYHWDDAISLPFARRVLGDRIPLIGWVAERRDGTAVPWREISSGRHDAVIAARADVLKGYGSKVMLIFHHEPEDDVGRFGTPADYAAAFRHVVSVFRERGATNVVWVWNLMAWTFNPRAKPGASAYYPGDRYVDWIGADGYNWFGSQHVKGAPWRSFEDVFGAFYSWGLARRKPLLLAEWGTLEDAATPERKARWFSDATKTLKRWPAIKAISYFNARGWWFDSSDRSLAAYRAMAHDPYFNPSRSQSAVSLKRRAED